MDLSLLETLREQLGKATRFSEVWDFFLTNFGEKPDFFQVGEKIQDEFLEQVLGQVGQSLFGKPVAVEAVQLLGLREHHFIHGSALINRKLTTILYFDDLCKGMLAIAWAIKPAEMTFARFTGVPMPDRWHRSEN
jgi:hypothetical protein